MKHSLYPLLGLFALGVSANANAQGDVTAILENLQAPVNNLTTGLQEGLLGSSNTAGSIDPGPAELNALSAPGVDSVPLESIVDSVASRYGRLLQSILNNPDALLDELSQDDLALPELPFVSLETAPGDLKTIAANLGNVPEAAIEGMRFDAQYNQVTEKTGLRDAAVELLRGNLVEPTTYNVFPFDPLRPSAINSTLIGVASATEALFADTAFDGEYSTGPFNVPFLSEGVSGAFLDTAFIGYDGPLGVSPLRMLVPVEEELVPVFESAEPLTLPLIQQIEDF